MKTQFNIFPFGLVLNFNDRTRYNSNPVAKLIFSLSVKKKFDMIRIVLFLIATVFFAEGCSSDDESIQQSIEFSLIAKGELYGNGDEMLDRSSFVVKDSNAWNELISKMDTVNEVSKDFIETDIDFDSYYVIAVFDEIRNYGGNSIEVTEINEYTNKIVVKIDQASSDGLNAVISQPFHLVKIKKTQKSISFDN